MMALRRFKISRKDLFNKTKTTIKALLVVATLILIAILSYWGIEAYSSKATIKMEWHRGFIISEVKGYDMTIYENGYTTYEIDYEYNPNPQYDYRIGFFGNERVRQILDIFEKNQFWGMNDSYGIDMSYYIFTITTSDKSKTLTTIEVSERIYNITDALYRLSDVTIPIIYLYFHIEACMVIIVCSLMTLAIMKIISKYRKHDSELIVKDK